MREERLRNQAKVNESDETTELKLLIGKLAILRVKKAGRSQIKSFKWDDGVNR